MYGRKATVNDSIFAEVIKKDKSKKDESKKFNGEKIPPEAYYKMQSCNTLRKNEDLFKVYVHFDAMISKDWKDEILQAIKDISTAAPGLSICTLEYSEMSDESKRPVVRIVPGISENNCTTTGNVKSCKEHKHCPGFVFVEIGECCDDYDNFKKINSRCELLHALGFELENQRSDGECFMNYPTDEDVRDDPERETFYQKYCWTCAEFFGITPFDVFSVMLFEESESIGYCRKTSKGRVWSVKCDDTGPNIELSELDKLALNLVYPPCRSSTYAPEQSENGMYYCGRDVMSNHNRPDPSLAKQDRCQKGGPNCPACRTLSKPKKDGIEIESQWQGWSGFVYCGKNFESEGESKVLTCGIHNGKPCPDCHKIVKGHIIA